MKTLTSIMATGAFLTIVAVHAASGGTCDLADHGKWTVVAGYGRAWKPDVSHGHNWHPYRDGGCWVSSQAGRVWQSSYPWATIVYGSGRWVVAGSFGWFWVPGREYYERRVTTGSYSYSREQTPPPRTYSSYTQVYFSWGSTPVHTVCAPVPPRHCAPPVHTQTRGHTEQRHIQERHMPQHRPEQRSRNYSSEQFKHRGNTSQTRRR